MDEAGNQGQFADDDPEYQGDAAADIGADVAAEIVELTEDDPEQIPPDEGNPGQPTGREEP
jgi:hypothetical protein